ncbi:MAG: hypothetical protein HY906_23515 [Deltaproteobacteria bacterium]|nr:hypothetical protein [Deltaproteobacteria bacterium]
MILAATALAGWACSGRTPVQGDGGPDAPAADAAADMALADGGLDDATPTDGPPPDGILWCRSWVAFDCPLPQDCDTRSCSPGAMGQCVLHVVTCPDTVEPVCGCNGTTYANNCFRLHDRMALKQAGACDSLPGDGGTCLDWDLEPNDAPATATPLDAELFAHPDGFSLYGLEVCSPSDLDYYSFALTSTRNVSFYVGFISSLGAVSSAILDSALTEVALGGPGVSQLEAHATLGPGICYLRVGAGPGGTTNSYDFQLVLQ